jgi:uncharacterized surface protein with fasciclin (FAS1) repeats
VCYTHRFHLQQLESQTSQTQSLMKNLSKTINGLFIFGCALFLTTSSCKNNDPNFSNDAINRALLDSRFTIFSKLLADNDLVNTLNATESYTIFAPTNEAFSRVDISKLTKKELIKLLNTHIVTKRRLLANEIKSGVVKSPNVEIYLSKNTSGVYVNGISKVTVSDILASNSVIHAIDQVIIPPTKGVLETFKSNSNFSELYSLISTVEKTFEDRLINASVLGTTMLAPTDAAFEELYKTIPKANLLNDKKLLNEILFFHLISGRIFSTDFQNTSEPVNTFMTPAFGTPIPLSGAGTGTSQSTIVINNPSTGQYQVVFDTTNGLKVKGIKSGNANITNVNLLTTNGVIHTIDKVLLP